MIRKWANGTIAALVLTLAVGASALGQGQPAPKSNDADPSVAGGNPAADAPEKDAAELASVTLNRAAKASKYTFVFFYRTADEPTQAARRAFDTAMAKFTDRALTAAVNVTDPLEQEVVVKYGVERSPTPLVLALAPNGAVTRGFPGQFTEAQLETAFVSPGMQKCLRALQDRKLAFLCVQNGTTQHNAEALQGVKEFAADAQYAKTTEIISVDPTDAAEESLLKQFKVDPKTDEAVTVFLAPPGTTVATYKGATQKDALIAAAKAAAKACTPGSSCCPAPKKPAGAPPQSPPQPGAAEKKP